MADLSIDTAKIRDSAAAVQQTCGLLETNRGEIEQCMDRILKLLQEEGIQQVVKRQMGQWHENNTDIQKQLRDLGLMMEQTGTDVDKVIQETQDELSTPTATSGGGGKYDSALNF